MELYIKGRNDKEDLFDIFFKSSIILTMKAIDEDVNI